MKADAHKRPESQPSSDFTPGQMRALKIAVVVMGIVLFVGFFALLGTIVYQASNLGKSQLHAAPAPDGKAKRIESELRLAPGQSVSAMELAGDRLAVHLKGPGGGEIRVIDLATGRTVSRILLKPE